MVDPNTDELVLLSDARKLFPQRPSKETVWRWALGRGLLGQRLDSTLIGSNRYTSKRSISEFVAAVNAADEARRREKFEAQQIAQPGLSAGERKTVATIREREIELARNRLAAAGLN